ncbi:MAG TPA: hypothetical protein VGN63_21610 [Flavisolibacter sp.]|jgi:hypothetical protein|nr:hypothetical protein [Flavisolibacter sp.]
MVEEFQKTDYSKYMVENNNVLEQEHQEFNKKIIELFDRRADVLGRVLKCHLIIEHYIDSYLESAFPTITHWKESRLSFSQKMHLIYNEHVSISMYFSAIKELNTIRNQFAHNLEYDIKEGDTSAIKTVMYAWYSALGKNELDGIALIEDFTLWFCGNLNILINGMRRHAESGGIAGYLTWVKDMTSRKS